MVGRLVVVVVAVAVAAGASAAPSQAVVDLGYAVHRAGLNTTSNVYAFNNIRFADPPTGARRFRPPVHVSSVNRTVNDGSVGFICPQGFPDWNLAQLAATTNSTLAELRRTIDTDPRQSEDCLFLNVVVPRGIFDQGAAPPGEDPVERKRAAVMVWIYGGGYTEGHKDEASFDPTGLLDRSRDGGDEGVVFVALNYRLGLYGFLNAGRDSAVFPNTGLLDQRLALEWVARYIHLFGGDAERVTVFGESAGGGSIMHHVTAEGGRQRAPFSGAIVQSPGFQVVLEIPAILRRTLATASKLAGRPIRTGAELASLDGPTLLKVNSRVVADSPNGTFTFGPTMDGGYVPDLPGVLLQQGRFDSRPKLMLGHNSNEGFIFLEPVMQMPDKIFGAISTFFPGIPSQRLNFIWNVLYPPPSNETAYKTDFERGSLLMAESTFTCNTRYLASAFRNETYNYRFQVPPGIHSLDLAYTFYNGQGDQARDKLARDMQLYFTGFAQSGSPVRASLPTWPRYGERAHLTTFGLEGIGGAPDDANNERCAYWQTGQYRS